MTRLIDADKLQQKVQSHKDIFIEAWGSFGDMPIPDRVRCDEIDNCIAEIVNAPTVEERPHGECRNCTHYNLFGLDENTTYCGHPALYCDDPFCGVALATKPQDTCSYFTPKGGDEE